MDTLQIWALVCCVTSVALSCYTLATTQRFMRRQEEELPASLRDLLHEPPGDSLWDSLGSSLRDSLWDALEERLPKADW